MTRSCWTRICGCRNWMAPLTTFLDSSAKVSFETWGQCCLLSKFLHSKLMCAPRNRLWGEGCHRSRLADKPFRAHLLWFWSGGRGVPSGWTTGKKHWFRWFIVSGPAVGWTSSVSCRWLAGGQVVFHYIGYNESARRGDNTYQKGAPAKTRVGINAMIPGENCLAPC